MASCPDLDSSLVGKNIAFRWDVGWELGVVTQILPPSYLKKTKRSRKATCPDTTFNFEVKFASDDGPQDVLLSSDRYSQLFTSEGAWRCFE